MPNDHLYTTSRSERDHAFAALDYVEEGTACYVLPALSPGSTPFYRYVNQAGNHLYTTSAAEGANAIAKYHFKAEGIACYVFAAPQDGTLEFLRLFNPKSGDHLYTTSSMEARNAIDQYGYQREGVAGWVYTAPAAGAVPLYRLLQSAKPQQHTSESQWATLLCKFSNEKAEPPAAQGVTPWRTVSERFLTHDDGSFNLVRFYADVSHGKLDLSGSQVLGWYDIDVFLNAPNAAGDRVPNKSQNEVIALAIQAAKKSGVKIEKFVGVIVMMNMATGWAQGSPGSVAMDWRRVDGRNFDGTLTPRASGGGNGVEAFAQEVGHGYGLDHSRIDGSDADYQDQWDAMSTLSSVFTIADPDYCARPPAFNAWNMRARGWLDETRVFSVKSGPGYSVTINLRPLHQRGLPGWLAAEMPGTGNHSPYLIEFRVPELWDAGIPHPVVLVHRFSGNEEKGVHYSPALLQQDLGIHSYIMKSTTGQASLQQGDVFSVGTNPSVSLTVLKMDAANKLVTIKLDYTS